MKMLTEGMLNAVTNAMPETAWCLLGTVRTDYGLFSYISPYHRVDGKRPTYCAYALIALPGHSSTLARIFLSYRRLRYGLVGAWVGSFELIPGIRPLGLDWQAVVHAGDSEWVNCCHGVRGAEILTHREMSVVLGDLV